MTVNVNNVIVGTAQLWYAQFGLTTPGAAEAPPADPTTPRVDSTATTVTSASATVADTHVVAGDAGKPVTSTTAGAIPAGTYVGVVTPSTSFTMVDINNNPVVATGSATTVTIAQGIGVGQPWGGAWKSIGATDQGVTFSVNSSQNAITIEEQFNPALYTTDSVDISLSFTLTEDVMENMLLAYGFGSIATQAAATGVIGKKTLTFGIQPNPLTVGFESNAATTGMFRRVYIPKMFSGGAKVDTVYRRAKAERMYAVTLNAVCDPTTIKITDQTATFT